MIRYNWYAKRLEFIKQEILSPAKLKLSRVICQINQDSPFKKSDTCYNHSNLNLMGFRQNADQIRIVKEQNL